MSKQKARSLRVANLRIPSHLILILWSLVALFPIWVLVVNSFKTRFHHLRKSLLDPEGMESFELLRRASKRQFSGVFPKQLCGGRLIHRAGAGAGRAVLFLVAGMMLPIKIASIRLLEMMRSLGLVNTLWSLVPIYVAMGIPISVFVLTGFIRQTPAELTEAGFMDGAGRFHIFRRLVLPLLRPALATVAIYNLIPFWNDLWFPLIFINKESSKTLLLGVTRLFGQYQTDWSKVLAVLALSAVPVIALYLLMSKQFIKGMTAGAVKG